MLKVTALPTELKPLTALFKDICANYEPADWSITITRLAVANQMALLQIVFYE